MLALRDDELSRLREENEYLRAEVEFLKDTLSGTSSLPTCLRLTYTEGRFLKHLLARDHVTKNSLMLVLYGDRIERDEPDIKIIDQFLFRVRRKLKPFGIGIETIRGNGFFMTTEMKRKLRGLSDGA